MDNNYVVVKIVNTKNKNSILNYLLNILEKLHLSSYLPPPMTTLNHGPYVTSYLISKHVQKHAKLAPTHKTHHAHNGTKLLNYSHKPLKINSISPNGPPMDKKDNNLSPPVPLYHSLEDTMSSEKMHQPHTHSKNYHHTTLSKSTSNYGESILGMANSSKYSMKTMTYSGKDSSITLMDTSTHFAVETHSTNGKKKLMMSNLKSAIPHPHSHSNSHPPSTKTPMMNHGVSEMS